MAPRPIRSSSRTAYMALRHGPVRKLRHAQIDVTMNVYIEALNARRSRRSSGSGGSFGSQALLYFAAVRHKKRPRPVVGGGL